MTLVTVNLLLLLGSNLRYYSIEGKKVESKKSIVEGNST